MRLLTVEILLLDDPEAGEVDTARIVGKLELAIDRNEAVLTDWRVAPAKIVVAE